jgi:hypothetical protein
MQEALLQLLVTAAPAVTLYFTGWSYLYFYFDAFKINMSEMTFDVPTIFIYSYPPLHTLWEFHGTAVILIVIIAPVLALVARAVWLYAAPLPPWVRNHWLMRSVRFILQQIGDLPVTAWTLLLLLFLVFVLPFPITALTASAASRAANRVWDGQYIELDATLKKEPADKRRWFSRLWDAFGETAEDKQQEQLIASYRACMKEGELGLIFSADAHYYLLCRASLDQDSGNVFEVAGKEGLISVRSVVIAHPGRQQVW